MCTEVASADSSSDREECKYSVDTSIYSLDALFRACYRFTRSCYLFLEPGAPGVVIVSIRAKHRDVDLSQLVGEFANELIDQRIRSDLARETKAIKELIVAQAFGEARFTDSPQ